MARKPSKNLYLYLALACFLGIVLIFLFDGYLGVYDSLQADNGTYAQQVAAEQWQEQDRFEGTFATETVERLLHESYDLLAATSKIPNYLPLLAEPFAGTEKGVAEENIQSRIRGTLLMALSNKHGHLLLATGNKSEYAVGYATLYGDMAGGFAPLKDVYKTTVYELSRFRNQSRLDGLLGPAGRVIPERIITRPPTAELRPDQTDQDSLPPYDQLDQILECLVEGEMGADEIIAKGFPREVVTRVQHLLYIAEYKRRQAPPGVKVSRRSFGRDRRYPITNRYRALN